MHLCVGVDGDFQASICGYAALQAEVVSDAENPAPEIVARLSIDQMLEQSEEDFLHYFFAILQAKPGGEQIAQESVTPGVE
jgi:hypothetical protein